MHITTLWAKKEPFQSVETHGIVCGNVCEVLLRQYMAPGIKRFLQTELNMTEHSLQQFLCYLASVHDIGKLIYGFQAQDKPTKEILDADPLYRGYMYQRDVRHEMVGQVALAEIWTGLSENEDSVYMFSQIIGAHHQGKSGQWPKTESNGWKALQMTFEKEMRAEFLGQTKPILPLYNDRAQGAIGAMILGVVILSDWISSLPIFDDAEDWIKSPEANDVIRMKAESFLRESGLVTEQLNGLHSNLNERVTAVQKRTNEHFTNTKKRTSLFLIEAPFSEEKQEAAIAAAFQMACQWERSGVYIALPPEAMSAQTVEIAWRALQKNTSSDSHQLIHAMSWIEDTEKYCRKKFTETDPMEEWLEPGKRGLLSQYTVGNINQLLSAVTTVKYGAVRLLGVANKAIVINDVSSYDEYAFSLLLRLLEWCKILDVPVVLQSGPLSNRRKQKILDIYHAGSQTTAYPLLTAALEDGTLSETPIITDKKQNIVIETLPILGNAAAIAKEAIRLADSKGCIAVVMNTVAEAQKVFERVKAQCDIDLVLFHAQFTDERRIELESECLRKYGKSRGTRPQKSILITTQVFEQTLDIDVDAIISSVAPVNILLQRLERVRRFSDGSRQASSDPDALILIPEIDMTFGSSLAIYPEYQLEVTAKTISNQKSIDLSSGAVRFYATRASTDEGKRVQFTKGTSMARKINAPGKVYNALYDTIALNDNRNTHSSQTENDEMIRIALLDQPEYDQLKPHLRSQEKVVHAIVCDKTVAEMVMRHSVSVKASRLGKDYEELRHVHGEKLLANVWIFPSKDGRYRLENKKEISIDPTIGLKIKEGES